MLNDNRKIDYRILLSESLSRFNNRLSKTKTCQPVIWRYAARALRPAPD